jgi:ribose-phosphate pyrophosphokinase
MLKINGYEIKPKQFTAGENYFSKDDIKKCLDMKSREVCIEYLYDGDESIFQLALLKDTLDEVIFEKFDGSIKIFLYIDYLPHARMDRKNDSYGFHLKTLANIINNMNFSEIHILEPHSDVTLNLIANSTAIYNEANPIAEYQELLKSDNNPYIVFPDNGAAERYIKNIPFYKKLSRLNRIIILNKKRDFATGKITSMEYSLKGYVPKKDNEFVAIIVDDICGYGNTFLKAQELLKTKTICHFAYVEEIPMNTKQGIWKNDNIKIRYRYAIKKI